MNTSKLADISEIVSSIAILATLIYLTIQVQQNTLASRDEADVAIYSMASSAQLFVAESKEIADLMVRSETTSWEDFSKVEKVRIEGFWGTTLNILELQFRLYKRKGDRLENIVFPEHILGWESFRSYWKSAQFFYEDNFIVFLDTKIANAMEGT
jgi:hypothetical protein